MNQKQRHAQQIILAHQGIAHLEGVGALFGAEDGAGESQFEEFEKWQARLDEFKEWINSESPIA